MSLYIVLRFALSTQFGSARTVLAGMGTHTPQPWSLVASSLGCTERDFVVCEVVCCRRYLLGCFDSDRCEGVFSAKAPE